MPPRPARRWPAVLNPAHPSRAAPFSSKFVHAAKHCLDLGNFFSFFAILAALDAPGVNAFVRVGRGLPDKLRKLLAEMQAVTDPSRNMKAYRDLYSARHMQPRLPFLPLHLKDLYFAAESLKGGTVMVKDVRLVTRLILRDSIVWQPYRMRSDYGMQGYFRVSVPLLPSDEKKTGIAEESDAAPAPAPAPAAQPPTTTVTASDGVWEEEDAPCTTGASPPSTPKASHSSDAKAAPPSALRGEHLRAFALTSLTSPAVKDKVARSRSTTPSALRDSVSLRQR